MSTFTAQHPLYTITLCLIAAFHTAPQAEELNLSPAAIWQDWTYPAGALHLENNTLRPVLIKKNIDPLPKASVRAAGASPSTAGRAFDGDPTTGWSPPPGTPLEKWWIEIDLGQVYPLQGIRLKFDPQAPPLPFFNLSFSKGERFINSANVLVEGTLLYSGNQRFVFNEARELELALDDELVQVIRLEATRLPEGAPVLTEIEVDAFGDNIAFDLLAKGGSVDVEAAIVAIAGTPIIMFDGDLSTMWRVNPLAKGSTGGGQTFGDYRIDLGATYRIDDIWLLGEPLGVPPRLRQFYANFLSYRLLYSDGSIAPDGTLAWRDLAGIPSDRRNLFEVRNFRHRFAPVEARYLRLFYPTSEGNAIIGGSLTADAGRYDGLGLVSEFQVYGQGYPARVVLRSPVIDLGSDWNITRLEWDADTPPGSQFILRSRSGDEVIEEKHYFDKNGKEVTQRRYDKLIASFRGPIETNLQPSAGWSPWSEEYVHTGSLFRSPSPRRYVQLEMEMLSETPDAAVSLDGLTLVYSRPLARTAVGEIQPAVVEPGAHTRFTYILTPEFGRDSQGFDAIVLDASVPVDFSSLQLDGVATEAELEPMERGIRVRLPNRVAADSRLELAFDATVFQNRTRFRTFIERRDGDETLRQQVDPGDAAAELAGAGDVVTLPVNQNLINALNLGSGLFTPNGDGINDVLAVSFDVLKINDARPIVARIYDLHGRRVRTLSDNEGVAGHYRMTWDGRDDAGVLVPPGHYLFHLKIDGDANAPVIIRSVGLGY